MRATTVNVVIAYANRRVIYVDVNADTMSIVKSKMHDVILRVPFNESTRDLIASEQGADY